MTDKSEVLFHGEQYINEDYWRKFWNWKVKNAKNSYDAAARGSSPEIEYFWTVNHVSTMLALKNDDVLLDAGCGTAIMALLICPFVKHVTGFDISEIAIEKARENIGNIANVNIGVGSLTKMPVRDGVYSKVLSYGTFQYLTDLASVEKALREVYRVMSPGGKALIGNNPDINLRYKYLDAVCMASENPEVTRENENNFQKNICWTSRDEMAKLAESIGFKASIIEIPQVIFQGMYMFDLLLEKPA